MTTTVADITISANLIDDSLYIEKPPICADSLKGRFTVLQNSSNSETASELLTVDAAGDGLKHFLPEPSSNSGWTTSTYQPTPGTDIDQLAAFYHSDILNVLALYPPLDGVNASSWVQRDAAGNWSDSADSGALTDAAQQALASTWQTSVYTNSSGDHYLYGVSAESTGSFFIIGWNSDSAQWDRLYIVPLNDFDPALSPGSATFKLNPGSDGNDFTITWCSGSDIYFQDANLVSRDGSQTLEWVGSTPSYFSPDIGDLSGPRWVDLPLAFAANNLLLLDNDNALYLFQNFRQSNASELLLTGRSGQPAGAVDVSAGADGSGTLMIYLLESGDTPQLWYLPQDNTDTDTDIEAGSDTPLAFGNWVTLGDILDTAVSPLASVYGPELYMVDQDTNVYHLLRTVKSANIEDAGDNTDQVWVTRKVAAPTDNSSSTAPTNVGSYNMEIAAVDQYGNPVPNAGLTLSADHNVTLIINDIAHPMNAGTQLTTTTDPMGQLTVKFQAMDLKPPLITFSSGAVSRSCQGDVAELKSGETRLTPLTQSVAKRLQGDDSSRPVSNSALQQAISPEQNPQLSIPALMSSSYDASTSGDAAGAIQAAGGWLDPSNQSGDGSLDVSTLATPHWEIDFTQPGGPRFRVLSAEQARATAPVPRSDALLGGIGSVFGDVAHFFKHEWNALTHFKAFIDADNALNIVFNQTTSFIISTVKQAGEALETVFNRIVEGLKDVYEAVEDVIKWLKMLFEWQDILTTHQVIKQCVNTTLDNLTGVDYNAAQSQVSSGISGLQTQVNNALDQLQGTFSEQSFNTYTNSANTANTATSSSNVLAATDTRNAHQSHASHSNYVWSKSKTHASALSGLSAAAPSTACDPSAILASISAELQSQFSSAAQNMSSYVSGQLTNPGDFFTLGIADFVIEAAKEVIDLTMDSIEDLLLAVLKLAQCAIEGLQALLNQSLDIPVLSWLYKNVITGSITDPGDDLTLLDLLCLIAAVPATIIYKVLEGSAPFSSSDAQTIKDSGLPWPSQWPTASALAGGPGAGAIPSALLQSTDSTLPDALLQTLGVVGGISALFMTLAQCVGDPLAAAEEEQDPLNTIVSWTQIGIGVFQWGVAAPAALSAQDPNAADDASIIAWSFGALQLLLDTTFTIADGADVEFQSEVGPIADSLMGVFFLALGTVAAVEQAGDPDKYSGWDVAASIVVPLDGCFRFLVNLGEDGLVILLPLDFFCGMGSMAVQIGAALDD